MKASRGEIKISELLTLNNMDFEEEYIFPDLISNTGRPLRFDFCVFDDAGDIDFLIEYQGIQHYEAKSIYGGEAGFRKQQQYDTRKRIYCKEHGYTLVEIPYWDESRITFDYIMLAAGY